MNRAGDFRKRRKIFSQKKVREFFYVLNALYHNKVDEIKEKNMQVSNATYQALATVQKNEKLLKGISKDGKEDVKMCSALEKIWEDGRLEGREEAKKETIGRMLQQGFSSEQIAQAADVSLEIVNEMANKFCQ